MDHTNPNSTLPGGLSREAVACAIETGDRSVMATSDENPCEESLILDVIGPCGCCTYTGVASSEFLEAFVENLPELGEVKLLRIHGVAVPGLLFRRCGIEN